MTKCNICPRKCNRDRDNETGICGVGNDFVVARASLHMWEEPCISGENGSGTIFFSGCNLRCVFCQNYDISHGCFGQKITAERFNEIVQELINKGANNINLVNPTHYTKQIAEVLSANKPSVPVVYNSSGYESVESLKLLKDVVDVYLPDFKYISSDRAEKYSAAKDYPEVAEKAIAEMLLQQPENIYDDNGIIQKGVVIRHLILPKNTNQSLKILERIKELFGTKVTVSLMGQYTPYGEIADMPELQRKLTEREYNKVVDYALELGFDNLYIQSLESSDENFIPNFDLTGV